MPNAKRPGETLEESVEVMRQATVNQLRTALVMEREGVYLPTFAPFLAPFRALRGAV